MGDRVLLESILDEKAMNSNITKVIYTKTGYHFQRLHSFHKVLNTFKSKILLLDETEVIESSPTNQLFLQKLRSNELRLALAFKKYDRLEWILGDNQTLVQILWHCIGSPYELELREYKHDGQQIDGKLKEPTPIEGYVIKLSDRMGNFTSLLGKHYFKLFYAFTCDNILFFQNFYRSVPVFPTTGSNLLPNTFISPAGEVIDLDELLKASKFESHTFVSTPYPMTKNHISWLHPQATLDDYNRKDSYALYDAERRAGLVSSAHSMVDLLKVRDIRRVPSDKISPILKASGNLIWGNDNKIGDVEEDFLENCFELLMSDNSVVRLNVCSAAIRDEWIGRLKTLCHYWSCKKSEDLMRRAKLRQTNLKLMNTEDDHYEASVANQSYTFSSKQELTRAHTDEEVYSISSYVLDKPILNSGYIYCRSISGRQFKKLFVVLSPGFLVLYKVYNRSKSTNVAKNSTYFKKIKTIPLSTCYVFSEIGCASHAYKKSSFLQSSSEAKDNSRLYSDGWRSSESNQERMFSLWMGTTKIMVKDTKDIEDVHELMSESSDDELELSESKKASKTPKKTKVKRNILGIPTKKSKTKLVSDNIDQSDSEANEYLTTSGSDADDEMYGEMHHLEKSPLRKVVDDAERISPVEMLKTVSKLGVPGQGLTFLARSRIDRDIWVTRLMTEIERFSTVRNSDVCLV